jgi:phosphoribosylanthranilate isomerase
MRDVVAPLRASRRIILAGGLRADNVVRAIRSFAPDVVDVSSGVEVSPGLKDPARMRAFVDAVHGVALA